MSFIGYQGPALGGPVRRSPARKPVNPPISRDDRRTSGAREVGALP